MTVWGLGLALLTGGARAAPDELLLDEAPTTLHPLYPWTREDQYVHGLIHEPLFESDGKGAARSDVLESWRAEGSVIELHLARRKWHDGEPFVAADVCATVERIRAADRPTAFTAMATSLIVNCLAGDDDRIVRITMAQAPIDPARSLSFPLIPAHDPDWAGAGPKSSLTPNGLGRYRIEQVDDGYLLRRAGKGTPYRKLLLRIVPTPAALLSRGEGVGAPFVEPAELATARSIEGISLNIEPANSVWALLLNTHRGPLASPSVRGALDRALDRSALAEAWFGRDGDLDSQPWVLTSGPFPPRSSRASAFPVPQSDPEAARAALLAAGLTESDGGWLWNGAPWTLRVAVPLGLGPEPAAVQRALAEQLHIRIEVVPLTNVQWWFSLLAGGHTDVTDAALMPIPASDPGLVLHTRSAQKGIFNPFGFSDPEIDAFFDGQLDDGAAFSLHGRLDDIHPALFLFAVDGRSAWRGAQP